MTPTNRGTRHRLHDLPRCAAAEPRDGRRLDAAGRATASTTCPAAVTAGATLPRQPRRPGLRRLCFAPPPPDASRSPARSAQQAKLLVTLTLSSSIRPDPRPFACKFCDWWKRYYSSQ